ncbi:MAG TPA: hypothetical protein EYQ00_08985 [Dehalococcoidia bacterium]|nr:hypothetical protein [Dehalococcoidia bacterium]
MLTTLIILLINADRGVSSISDLKRVSGVKIEDMGRSYRDRSKSIRYTSINRFKGLEADAVFVLDLPADTAKDDSNLYTQASRAQTHLIVIRRQDVTEIWSP